MGASVAALVAVIRELNTQVARLEEQLAAGFGPAPGRQGRPIPARTGDGPGRPGARRVRGRPGPLHRC